MTFPNGGDFVGEDMQGKANFVEWEIDAQRIMADGDVSVLMQSPASPPTNNTKEPAPTHP
jgi:hypothetical protein